jgi:hypothetical protein
MTSLDLRKHQMCLPLQPCPFRTLLPKRRLNLLMILLLSAGSAMPPALVQIRPRCHAV